LCEGIRRTDRKEKLMTYWLRFLEIDETDRRCTGTAEKGGKQLYG
jgi:hypothetical protein